MKLPRAKSTDIVVMSLENETLIYNLKTNKAFCLNKTAAVVYQHCDGKTTFAEISEKHRFSDDLIFFALDELKKEQLIEADDDYQSPFAQMKRREVIKKIGFASMIALPLVASIVAPTAIQAGASCQAFGIIPCNPPGTNVGFCGQATTNPLPPVCVSYCSQRGFEACFSGTASISCTSVPGTPLNPPQTNCICTCQ